jgi:hypothetical protein
MRELDPGDEFQWLIARTLKGRTLTSDDLHREFVDTTGWKIELSTFRTRLSRLVGKRVVAKFGTRNARFGLSPRFRARVADQVGPLLSTVTAAARGAATDIKPAELLRRAIGERELPVELEAWLMTLGGDNAAEVGLESFTAALRDWLKSLEWYQVGDTRKAVRWRDLGLDAAEVAHVQRQGLLPEDLLRHDAEIDLESVATKVEAFKVSQVVVWPRWQTYENGTKAPALAQRVHLTVRPRSKVLMDKCSPGWAAEVKTLCNKLASENDPFFRQVDFENLVRTVLLLPNTVRGAAVTVLLSEP